MSKIWTQLMHEAPLYPFKNAIIDLQRLYTQRRHRSPDIIELGEGL